MSEKYKFHDRDGIYFITSTIVYWVNVFTKPEYFQIILQSLKHCQESKGLNLHAWVIMSNHLHLIVSRTGELSLPEILRDFKKFTSKEIIHTINNSNDSRRKWMLELFAGRAEKLKRIKHYKVWQDGTHPIHLENNLMIDQRLNYLHNNPVKAGIVNQAEHYTYSSAIDYSGGKGLLNIELIDL